MKLNEIKVIAVGIGEMGKVGVQTLLDHNVNIVAAIDINDAIIGKDVAEVSGYPACGTLIEKDLKTAIERTKPNVAFFASDPGMEYIKKDMILCAENKINVVTTIMDTFYRFPATAEAYDEIDKAFKDNGVSLFASGINDVWWSGIGMDMAGTCKKVEAIDFSNLLPLEGMGLGVARDFRVGFDPNEYIKEMEGKDLSQEEAVSGPLSALYVNADIMKLEVVKEEISTDPCVAKEDIPMPQWDMTIKAGTMTGQSFSIRLETKEGITLTNSTKVKVLTEGEAPGTSWTIKGEPDLHVELGDICGEITTASTTINRIPQVINARPGIVTLADLTERPEYIGGKW